MQNIIRYGHKYSTLAFLLPAYKFLSLSYVFICIYGSFFQNIFTCLFAYMVVSFNHIGAMDYRLGYR